MEEITNFDLQDVYCPYRQKQCTSTCAMLICHSGSRCLGTHSWAEEDGWKHQADVYQRYTDYWCGIASSDEGRHANKTRVYGPVTCNGKPFDGITDENIRELASQFAKVREEES